MSSISEIDGQNTPITQPKGLMWSTAWTPYLKRWSPHRCCVYPLYEIHLKKMVTQQSTKRVEGPNWAHIISLTNLSVKQNTITPLATYRCLALVSSNQVNKSIKTRNYKRTPKTWTPITTPCRPQQNRPKQMPSSPSEPHPSQEYTGGPPGATTKSSKNRPVLQQAKWTT